MTRLYHVDAFTEVPFGGNPAAVCTMDQEKPDEWMQSVAAEMNLSETAFLFRESSDYRLRWFTPKNEVTLCGHATLASAHILWSEGFHRLADEIRFKTASGTLVAQKNENLIVLDFPAREVAPCRPDGQVNRALGVSPIFTGIYTAPNGSLLLLELDSEKSVRNLIPDFNSLSTCAPLAVIVTSRSDSAEYDFVSRFFAPAVGIDEDPVTGSSHCSLAPYWSGLLGKSQLIGLQVSQRGGVVVCRRDNDRVFLQGRAVTISKAELLV